MIEQQVNGKNIISRKMHFYLIISMVTSEQGPVLYHSYSSNQFIYINKINR